MLTADKDAPIGVFDSGLGGISVLRKMVQLMPNERYIYYGDSANAPYGEKTDDEVFELTKNVFETLLKKGVKGIVIACNTATSVAEKRLQELYPDVPIAGIEPAVRLAAERIGMSPKEDAKAHKEEVEAAKLNGMAAKDNGAAAKDNGVAAKDNGAAAKDNGAAAKDNGAAAKADSKKRIAVMATAVTLRRQKYLDLKDSYSDIFDIVSLPCPEIVRFVEADGWSDEQYTAKFQQYLIDLFEKHGGKENPFDAVVLGCTHFPFVSEFVRKAVGSQAILCDGSEITSENMYEMLKERNILTDRKKAANGEIPNDNENQAGRDVLAKSEEKDLLVEIMNSAGNEKIEQSWALFQRKSL